MRAKSLWNSVAYYLQSILRDFVHVRVEQVKDLGQTDSPNYRASVAEHGLMKHWFLHCARLFSEWSSRR